MGAGGWQRVHITALVQFGQGDPAAAQQVNACSALCKGLQKGAERRATDAELNACLSHKWLCGAAKERHGVVFESGWRDLKDWWAGKRNTSAWNEETCLAR